MSQYLSSCFSELTAYVAGEQPKDKNLIKLNTNESPYPPSPLAIKAVNGEILANLRLYNDNSATALTQAIANNYNVLPENVITSNGSDEVLAFAFLAYGKDKPIAFANITYGFYSVFAQLYSITSRIIPLTDSFEININDYLQSGENVIIANPNAPTGIALPLASIRKICEAHPNDVVMIDEAYIDFGGESAVSLINEFKNLIVIKTFSKSRSLAGARVGYALACKELIDDLQRIRNSFNPYNVNAISQAMATAAMEDKAYFNDCTRRIISCRSSFTQQLINLGFTVLPSQTNFVFAKAEKLSGKELYHSLRKQKILVRWFDKPQINEYLRISIGNPEEISYVIKVLHDITQNGGHT